MNLPSQFIHSVSEFIKVALDLNDQHQDELLYMKKQAAVAEINKEKYKLELNKAANDLYDSDFITDEAEKRTFLRKAAEDPIYVVRFLSKISRASDVAQLGKAANVSTRYSKEAQEDPVMRRAFGLDNSSILDD